MHKGLTGRQPLLRTATRMGLAPAGLFLALTLAACTTVEGTNALTDVGTFEREVMSTTARGIGLIPGEAPKEDITSARAPLVLPKSGNNLPAPAPEAAAAQLPADSDTVQINTAGLTEADIQRLRNAKVVDLNAVSGRPLTAEEARMLTANLQKNNVAYSANSQRPLYLPPEEYFTRVGDADLVCAIGGGQVVPLSDPRCPDEVRKALRAQGPVATGSVSQSIGTDMRELAD